MSYDTEKGKVGRYPYFRIEIDMPTCSNVYGGGLESPLNGTCVAAGTSECRNTRNTCQDTDNFTATTTTLRLCDEGLHIPGVPMRPYITAKELSETVIRNDKALGQRAQIKITCRDEPSDDRDIDPYWATRPYNAAEQGTWWGKVKSIFRYYPGSVMRVITGYIGDTYSGSDIKTRYYILDEINGPENGSVTLIGKDILKLAEDTRALCPMPTTGVLSSGINNSSTSSFTLTDGAGQYAASGRIRIGSEIISYTSGSDSGDDFTIGGTITRGVGGSTASAHSAGDTAQSCYRLNDNVVDVVYDLLVNFGNISSSYITFADWEIDRDIWLNNADVDFWLTKSEGVTKLITDLGEQYLFNIWWDDISQKVRFKPVSPFNQIASSWNDTSHILNTGASVEEQTDRRLSRVIVYYNPINQIEYSQPEHFASIYAKVDADSESSDLYGDIRSKIIYARFISSDGMAVRCGSRTLSQYLSIPKQLEIYVDAKDSDVKTGDPVNISSRSIQDVDGSNKNTLMQVISRQETSVGTQWRYLLSTTAFSGRYGRIVASSSPILDYTSASDLEKASGCWICGAGGQNFADDGEPYLIS